MLIYLVWTGYEDVEAAFFDKATAEQWITEYIEANPTYGGYRPRDRSEFSITEIEVQ